MESFQLRSDIFYFTTDDLYMEKIFKRIYLFLLTEGVREKMFSFENFSIIALPVG